MNREPQRATDYFTPPPSELERLKVRREAWRVIGPGHAEWLREAKRPTLAKLDAAIAELERERSG